MLPIECSKCHIHFSQFFSILCTRSETSQTPFSLNIHIFRFRIEREPSATARADRKSVRLWGTYSTAGWLLMCSIFIINQVIRGFSVLQIYFMINWAKWYLTNNHSQNTSIIGFLFLSKCVDIITISFDLYRSIHLEFNVRNTKLFSINLFCHRCWYCCCRCWSNCGAWSYCGGAIVVFCISFIGTIGTWIWCKRVQRCAGHSFSIFYHAESQEDAAKKTRRDSHFRATFNNEC